MSESTTGNVAPVADAAGDSAAAEGGAQQQPLPPDPGFPAPLISDAQQQPRKTRPAVPPPRPPPEAKARLEAARLAAAEARAAAAQAAQLEAELAAEVSRLSSRDFGGAEADDKPVLRMNVRMIPPVRNADGDLLLLCPVRTTLRKNSHTRVAAEATVVIPSGWRGLLSTPDQLRSNRIVFASFLINPADSGAMFFELFNASAVDVSLEAGAPLAVLSLIPFRRNTAEVRRVTAL